MAHDDPPPVHVLAPVPTAPAQQSVGAPPATPVQDPTATDVAQLYAVTGRELSALETNSAGAAIDLWPRYRWIRINDVLSSQPKRTEAYLMLQRLRRDIAATRK